MYELNCPFARFSPPPSAFRPHGDKYIVKARNPRRMITGSGLLLGGESMHQSTSADGKMQPGMYFGEIISRGKGVFLTNGGHLEPQFEAGQLVCFDISNAFEITQLSKFHGESEGLAYLALHENTIFYEVDPGELSIDEFMVQMYGEPVTLDETGKVPAPAKADEAPADEPEGKKILIG